MTYLICSNLKELQEIVSPIEEADRDFSESSSSPNLFVSFLVKAKNIPFVHLQILYNTTSVT